MKAKFAICLFLCAAFLFVGCPKKNTEVSEKKEETKIVSAEPNKIEPAKVEEKAKTEPNTKPAVKVEEKTMIQEPNKAVLKGTTRVRLQTTMGNIVIELDEQKAPATSANFLKYVKEGLYNGTIFHRVMPNFMIQGGGFTPELNRKPTFPAIKNEASNGLKNDRGTVAMARTKDPDSATSQFFINVVDNNFLNYVSATEPGYAVFGKVVEGMDVVDKIRAVPTVRGISEAVPVTPVVIQSAQIVP